MSPDVVSRSVELDRCAGVLMGLAAGDALGTGYEFAAVPTGDARMIGGGLGGWEVGEWTDDTQMALCIAQEGATGALDPGAVAQRFLDWYRSGPADVGIQTASVLGSATGPADVAARARAHLAAHPDNSAGNGSLMRTGPVALLALGNDTELVRLATGVSSLTHADPLAGEACVLWCVAIDRAVRQGRLDGIDDGLALLPSERRARWAAWIAEARTRPPASFRPNGYVVTALQAALAAISQTPVPVDQPGRHLRLALQAAVHIGDDTDTVAAIAGALLGARWGASAVPPHWSAVLHGWPGMHAGHLIRLGILSGTRGRSDDAGWPASDDMMPWYRRHEPTPVVAVPLTDDPGVTVANVAGAATVDADVVVSLCRVGARQLDGGVHARVLLWDTEDPADNPNLDLLLADLVADIGAWRHAGRTVLVHCAYGESRTPAVAAAYLADRLGIPATEAWARVQADLPRAKVNRSFAAALQRLWP